MIMSMMNKKQTQRKTIIMLENIPTIPSTASYPFQQPNNVLKPTSSSSSSSTSKYPSDINTGHQPVKKNQKHLTGHIVVSDSESDDKDSSTLVLPGELETRLMKHQLEGVQWMYGTFQRKTGKVQQLYHTEVGGHQSMRSAFTLTFNSIGICLSVCP